MSTTLTSDITAAQRTIAITGDASAAVPGRLYRIEDEIVQLETFEDVPDRAGWTGIVGLDPNSWVVKRGALESVPATHSAATAVYATRDGFASGASLAEPSPFDLPAQAADVGAAGTTAEIIFALRAAGLMVQTGVIVGFDQGPTAALIDATITPAITVAIVDDQEQTCTHDNTTEFTVELTIPGAATLSGTLTRTAVAGRATFDDLSVDTADTYTLTLTTAGLAEAESASFTISAP